MNLTILIRENKRSLEDNMDPRIQPLAAVSPENRED